MDDLEIAGHTWVYPDGVDGSVGGGWLFDSRTPPIAPIIKEDGSRVNAGNSERIGTSPIHYADKRTDGVRSGTPKRLALSWPARVDVRFVMYLRTAYVFAIPIAVEIPMYSAIDPEECWTPPDLDEEFLTVYYGRERNWKSGSVTVYKNDVVQSTGFTLDLTNGTITFASALTRTDVVTVTYTYLANFIVQEMAMNFLPAYADTTMVPDITLEEVV